MAQDLMNTSSHTPPDCFDEPGDGGSSGSEFAKFDSANPQKIWHGRDGEASYPGPYYAVNCLIELFKFEGKKLTGKITQQPGVPLPDVDKLNDEIPREDWEENPFTGEPRGPWTKQYTVLLVDPKNGNKVVVSNSTTSPQIAWERLKEQTSFMRKFRGELVYPEVMFSSKMMKTAYGFRMRPEFEITGWRNFGPPAAPAIAAPTAPVDSMPGAAVAPITPAEITGDSVDDIIPPPKKSAKEKKSSAKVAAKSESWAAPWDDEVPDLNP